MNIPNLRTIVPILGMFLLTACTTLQQPSTITVKVPVYISCLPDVLPEKPIKQFGSGTFTNAKEAAKILLIDYYSLELYSNKLEAVIAGCKTQ